jgi:hypothetical protein
MSLYHHQHICVQLREIDIAFFESENSQIVGIRKILVSALCSPRFLCRLTAFMDLLQQQIHKICYSSKSIKAVRRQRNLGLSVVVQMTPPPPLPQIKKCFVALASPAEYSK